MSEEVTDRQGEHRKADDVNPTNRRGLRHRIPYRMFGKRLASTKRLVVSSKVWTKAIPTHNCDVLLTFPAKADDSTLMWLLARLKTRTPQLIVHVRHHSNSGIYGFYMTATYDSLLKGAEELGIRKTLKSDYGGGMKEFTFEDHDCFAGVEEEKSFLTSQERQSVVYHLLTELRAVEGEQLGKIRFLEGQSIVPLLESKKVISQVFPLHNSEDLAHLRKTWVQGFFKKQPLNQVCEYFGVKIALYFAYLGHYTVSLCLPAFLGILVWCFQGDEKIDDVCFIAFAFFNVFWATLYLEHWKRTSSEFAYRWGSLDKKDELIKDPRPLHKGDLVRSVVTGRMEPYFASWKRTLFRYFVSGPVVGLCLAVVFFVMLLIFQLQEWVNQLIAQNDIPAFLRFCPKILLALSIGVLDEIYKNIAIWLNDKENYRLEETYGNQLILKLVLFQFVNSFLSLFYIAFYLQDMDRLRDQLAALLITRQVIGNLKEALLPYLIWKVRLLKVGLKITGDMSPSTLEKEIKQMTGRRDSSVPDDEGEGTLLTGINHEKGDKNSEVLSKEKDEDNVFLQQCHETKGVTSGIPKLTQAEVESAMKKYEDTYEDFLEMFIQFGYVTLFSSAFPLAALCALLNNIIEIRSDAFKLCVNHQRPFGKEVENIGIWQDALEVMGVIAVIVNCALIGMSGLTQRMAPGMNDMTTVIFIVVLEHIILMLKFCLAYAIPDIPEWVATEMAKVEFQRRQALKRLESQSSPGINSPDMRSRRIPPECSSTEGSRSLGKSSSEAQKTSPQSPTSMPSIRSATQTLMSPPIRNPNNMHARPVPPRRTSPTSGDSGELRKRLDALPTSNKAQAAYNSSQSPSTNGQQRFSSNRTVARSNSTSSIVPSDQSVESGGARSVPKTVPSTPIIPTCLSYENPNYRGIVKSSSSFDVMSNRHRESVMTTQVTKQRSEVIQTPPCDRPSQLIINPDISSNRNVSEPSSVFSNQSSRQENDTPVTTSSQSTPEQTTDINTSVMETRSSNRSETRTGAYSYMNVQHGERRVYNRSEKLESSSGQPHGNVRHRTSDTPYQHNGHR